MAVTTQEQNMENVDTSEIDGAVEDAMTKIEAERKAAGAPDKGDENGFLLDEDLANKDKGGKPEGEEEGDSTVQKPDENAGAITDEHIERAVKAGLSIEDAKAFSTPDSLERVCGVLEAKAAPVEKPAESEKPDDGGGVDETDLSEFPELDPEVYDEEIVKGFGLMRKLFESQNAAIRGLKAQAANAGKENWIESQTSSLGKDYADAIGIGVKDLAPDSPQAKKRAELEEKVSILEAGYKAAGKDVGRDSIFKEAVSLTMGDISAAAATKATNEALQQRSALRMNRPGSTRTKPTDGGDPLEDVAAEIDKKYFGK